MEGYHETKSLPPKRQTRRISQGRVQIMPSNGTLGSPLSLLDNSLAMDSPIRSFCVSNGLSDLAVRCGALNAQEKAESISDMKATSEIHPYATQTSANINTTERPSLSDSASMVPLPAPEISTLPTPAPTGATKKITKAKKPTPAEKGGKGLRHFSYLVMSKVEEKGTTTYQQVSDEIVAEMAETHTSKETSNIKRRVYDALNVLKSIGIISKQKKSIAWEGFPHHSAQALEQLQNQKRKILERIAQKEENLQELQTQFNSYQLVALRNQSFPMVSEDKKVTIPFILATSPAGSQIDCVMAENRSEYCISFQQPFKLYTEVQLLEMMNMTNPAHLSLSSPQPSHISPSSLTDGLSPSHFQTDDLV